VLAHDEAGGSLIDPEEELQRAKIAVRNPQILSPDAAQHVIEQRALIVVSVRIEKHISHQILLLVVNIMLVGRLIGVARLTSAYVWCLVLVVLLFPWQAFLSNADLTDPNFKIPGVLYTWDELRTTAHFSSEMSVGSILKWARFVGFPGLALVLLDRMGSPPLVVRLVVVVFVGIQLQSVLRKSNLRLEIWRRVPFPDARSPTP
jgi:hypothetical protein